MAFTLAACEKDPDMGDLDADLVVYTDHDNGASFKDYKTYYLPDSILEAGNDYHASYWKDDNAKAVLAAVEAQMNALGYSRITDPAKKNEANVGVQLSYIAQNNQVFTTGGYFNGWWDYGFWGLGWGGWYYPSYYPMTYSYKTNTLIMEMLDLTKKSTEGKAKIPVVWYASASGFQYNNRVNTQYLVQAVDQAFAQSDYLKKN